MLTLRVDLLDHRLTMLQIFKQGSDQTAVLFDQLLTGLHLFIDGQHHAQTGLGVAVHILDRVFHFGDGGGQGIHGA